MSEQKNEIIILAFESSCDETAVAIIDETGRVLANIIHSQKEHMPFGGIVPEIASRHHLGRISDLTQSAFDEAKLAPKDITHVAVTKGPGLIGALLVGAQFAKGFAQSLRLPLYGIHHLEGHLLCGYLDADYPEPPFIAMLASGGNSALYEVSADYKDFKTLGETRDDAAGEAYDKFARMLGIGYPGGQIVDEHAQKGDENAIAFPVALKDKTTLDYSFSGLKTSARLKVERLQKEGHAIEGKLLRDLCAGFQKAVSDALLNKAFLAMKKTNINTLVIGGGVSANSRLRSEALRRTKLQNQRAYIPPLKYCTDNAVMIAKAALRRILAGEDGKAAFQVKANISI